MANCKDCLHYGVCGGFTPTDLDRDVFDYCREGRTDEIPDIEERCNSFKDKSQYAEVKHGEWIDYYNNKYSSQLYVCSVCGKQALYEYFKDELDHIRTRQVLSAVCPHCGAKMDGGKDG